MSKRLDENLGSVGYDGLIVANEPVAGVAACDGQLVARAASPSCAPATIWNATPRPSWLPVAS